MTDIQKRPADATYTLRPPRPHIIETRPVPQGREEVMVDTRTRLYSRLRAGQRRREYAAVGRVVAMGAGLYQVRVRRVRAETPRWARPAIIAGCVLIALAGIGALGVWAFAATTSALAGKGSAIVAGVLALVAGALLLALRRPVVEVLVRVRR